MVKTKKNATKLWNNNTFAKKVNGESKHADYKSCSDVLITREDIIADIYDQKTLGSKTNICKKKKALVRDTKNLGNLIISNK